MIERHLRDFLEDSNASDRIGTNIHAGHVDAGVAGEAVVLQEISRVPAYDNSGESGLHELIVQIDCYSDSPAAAFTLSELIRNRLSGYRGPIGKKDPVQIMSPRIVSSGQEPVEPTDASDRWTHRYRQDWAMFARATLPTFA